MSAPTPALWQDLFVAGDLSNPAVVARFQIIQRSGRPFLILPTEPALAARALALYAAQTSRARFSKTLLGLGLKLKLPLGLPGITLAIEHDEPFAAFLMQSANARHFPRFAILPGNPHTPAPRFLLLLFNDAGEPAAVVKAGLGDAAVRLVAHEAAFLAALPTATMGVPKLRGQFRSTRVNAFALDFIPGESPVAGDEAGIKPLLTAWVDTSRVLPFAELPVWQWLAAIAGPQSPGWKAWSQLRTAMCHPALFHGDFAPWNVKVTANGWVALDWERGEVAGVPGWDWFHYVIQHAVLVRREPVPALAARVRRLLESAAFARYAERAKIKGLERPLLLGYLNHAVHVLKQTEELPRLQGLLEHLAGES